MANDARTHRRKSKKIWKVVRNSYTPSPLGYALTKNPIGSGTTM
jgi:hypothetical protein